MLFGVIVIHIRAGVQNYEFELIFKKGVTLFLGLEKRFNGTKYKEYIIEGFFLTFQKVEIFIHIIRHPSIKC